MQPVKLQRAKALRWRRVVRGYVLRAAFRGSQLDCRDDCRELACRSVGGTCTALGARGAAVTVTILDPLICLTLAWLTDTRTKLLSCQIAEHCHNLVGLDQSARWPPQLSTSRCRLVAHCVGLRTKRDSLGAPREGLALPPRGPPRRQALNRDLLET
jgi:hypothetical protein